MNENVLNQRVSPYLGENAKLDMDQRMENVEHDIVTQGVAMERIVEQNDKYIEYLDDRIAREHESYEFWKDVRKRLATAGIIGTAGIILSALGYAFTQWVKNT